MCSISKRKTYFIDREINGLGILAEINLNPFYLSQDDVSFLEVKLMQEIKNNLMDEVHVACPCCKNKRLFDANPMTEGIIKIKCPICKSVIAVSLHQKNIRTERIAV